jgi:glycine/D-amino acid oxidase-like deaminating enzyme
VDTNQANLVHAVGFSGHGLMHAPFTAALVSAAITGASGADRFTFPEPLHGRVIDTGCFAPGRSFAAPEGLVL